MRSNNPISKIELDICFEQYSIFGSSSQINKRSNVSFSNKNAKYKMYISQVFSQKLNRKIKKSTFFFNQFFLNFKK